MATHHGSGVAPVLELKPAHRSNGLRHKAPATVLSPVAEVRETPTDIVVRVRLQQGALELSVPKRALSDPRRVKSVIPGSNPDATPC